MKSNLSLLFRIEVSRVVAGITGNGKRLRNTPILYLAIAIVLAVAAASFGYSFLVIVPYVNAGLDPSTAVSLFAGAASMFIFMSTMRQARSIYIGDDHDMLSALPILKRDVVAVKIICLYLFELFFSVVVMVPHGIMMVALAHSVPLMLVSFLLAFTLPIVPIAVATLLSLVVTMATARFRFANLVFVAFYALLIVSLAALSMVLGHMGDTKAAEGIATVGGVLKWINPTYIFVEMSLTGSKLLLLAYVAANAVIALGTVLFLALLFDKLHDIVSSVSMKKGYVRKDLKVKTPSRQLLAMEFRRLANSKIYFVNAIIGSIMGILGSAMFIISFTQGMSGASADAVPLMRSMFIPIFIAVAMLIFGIGHPAASCINIEGKTFWITKTLPVDYRVYLRTKLIFTWILTLPACLIASTIAVVVKHDNAWEIVAAYLLPLLYSLFMSLVSMIVAIKHPKLKWNSEAEAVKNALSVLYSMLLNFGFCIVLAGVAIAVPLALKDYAFLAYIILTALIAIPMIPCAIYLHRNFAKKIRAMEDL